MARKARSGLAATGVGNLFHASSFKALAVIMFYITKMERFFGFPKKICALFLLWLAKRSF
jgi:hypothetical protein